MCIRDSLNADQAEDKFVLPSSILEIEGDLAYGEYLASDCQTCHRSDNKNEGIPGINGREIRKSCMLYMSTRINIAKTKSCK